MMNKIWNKMIKFQSKKDNIRNKTNKLLSSLLKIIMIYIYKIIMGMEK